MVAGLGVLGIPYLCTLSAGARVSCSIQLLCWYEDVNYFLMLVQ